MKQLPHLVILVILTCFIILSLANKKLPIINQRCQEMIRRFDSCIVTTFGGNELGQTPAAYLNENFPLFIDTLSGSNLTNLVQPESGIQQELYLGTNIFRYCHDYNKFETCLDFEFGQCLTNNLATNEIFHLLRGLVRRHGGERYEAVRFSDRRITDVTVGMDYLCGRKIGQLDKYRTCLLQVFQQNKALGFDAIALLEATRNGMTWSPRLCNQTQRFLNSLTFAIRRSCEADFKRAGTNATADIFDALNKLFAMSVEANEAFSPEKCRLFASSSTPINNNNNSNNKQAPASSSNRPRGKSNDNPVPGILAKTRPKSTAGVKTGIPTANHQRFNNNKNNNNNKQQPYFRPAFSVDYSSNNNNDEEASSSASFYNGGDGTNAVVNSKNLSNMITTFFCFLLSILSNKFV